MPEPDADASQAAATPPPKAAGNSPLTEGQTAPGRSQLTFSDAAFLPAERSLRRMPALLRSSIALTWHAAPRLFALTLLLDIIGGVGVAVQLLLGRRVLQFVLDPHRTGALSAATPSLIELFVVTVVLALAQSVASEQGRVQAELVTRMANDRIYEVSEGIDLASFEDPRFFDRLQRASINGTSRPLQMTSGLTRLITASVTVIAICAVLARLVPLLLPVAFLAYLPTWAALTRNSRYYYDFMVRMTGLSRRRSYLQIIRTGRNEAKEVRAFELAPLIKQRHDALYDDYIDGLRELASRRIRRSMLGSLANSALFVGVIALLAYLYLHHRVSVATAATAVAALLQLASQLSSVISGAAALYEGSLFLGDYESFVELSGQLAADAAEDRSRPAAGTFTRIAAEDVTFTYPGAASPSLRNVSIEVRAGEIVALVGVNGSGKTTLAKVVAGLFEPDGGRVTWGGTDVRQLNRSTIRSSVAVIFQDFIRYLMTAHDNIAAGRWQRIAERGAVERAADAAGASRFLSALPDGYESLLGKEFEGGIDLSVGQWQRVAIARAFFREAPLVILDEPTSALDPRAEKDLFDAVRALLAGRSVLLISHRFSSVRSADRIYVLQDGRVIESGDHRHLMAEEGVYAELYSMQAAAYADHERLLGGDGR